MKEMKKSDLVSGRTIVELANGRRVIFIEDFLCLSGSYEEEKMYTEDLEHCSKPEYNINKVKVFEHPSDALDYFVALDSDGAAWDWVRPDRGIQIIIFKDGEERINIANPSALILGIDDGSRKMTTLIFGESANLEELHQNINKREERQTKLNIRRK